MSARHGTTKRAGLKRGDVGGDGPDLRARAVGPNTSTARLLRLRRPEAQGGEAAARTARESGDVVAGSGGLPVQRLLPQRGRVPGGLGFSAVVYLLTRVPVVVGLAVFLKTHPRENMTSALLRYDGWWYVRLASDGYSTSLRLQLPSPDFHHRYSDWAFYPGYPLMIRIVHELTTFPYLPAALVASGVLGLTAIWTMFHLGQAFGGARAARASALLVAAWPGSAALSFPYAEGLFVTAAALALLCLGRQRWLSAGGFAGVAVVTRPSGLALLAAMGLVAAVRLVRDRDLRPLAGTAVASVPAAAFLAYAWARTGDPLVWRHAENLWGQRLDFSRALLHRSLQVLIHPLNQLEDEAHRLLLFSILLDLLGLLTLLLMAAAAVLLRRRLSPVPVAYSLVAVALIVGYSAVATRPRMVLAVLPGFVWLAAWLPRRLTLMLSAGFVLLLGVVTYLWSWQIPP